MNLSLPILSSIFVDSTFDNFLILLQLSALVHVFRSLSSPSSKKNLENFDAHNEFLESEDCQSMDDPEVQNFIGFISNFSSTSKLRSFSDPALLRTLN